jgi:signal transduction histidine kinase
VPVELAALPDGRLPEAVEAAAYYVACEALVNVARYANATQATVSIVPVDGRLVIEVADDGVGGADAGKGSGLRGLADRVEALDGRLELESEPESGTRLRAEIPLT